MKDRHILITGSSSGIGRATAQKLLEAGAVVYGIARNHEKFQPDTKRYKPLTIDVTDLKVLPGQLSDLLATQPEIDGLISNAGYGSFEGLENFSPEQIYSYINDNLTSHLVVTRCLLPHFKTKNRGDIIFIGSEAALEGGKKGSLYCATKFGLRGFSQSIRQESANKNIRVTLINPGMVRTSFFDDLNFQPGDGGENAIEPTDIADIIINILSMRSGTVVDEINLTPQKKVIIFD
jgi:3-hydroxy acid dehydrogenase/malonic semialdehyde reductase